MCAVKFCPLLFAATWKHTQIANLLHESHYAIFRFEKKNLCAILDFKKAEGRRRNRIIFHLLRIYVYVDVFLLVSRITLRSVWML